MFFRFLGKKYSVSCSDYRKINIILIVWFVIYVIKFAPAWLNIYSIGVVNALRTTSSIYKIHVVINLIKLNM